jgi:hypothetical protein
MEATLVPWGWWSSALCPAQRHGVLAELASREVWDILIKCKKISVSFACPWCPGRCHLNPVGRAAIEAGGSWSRMRLTKCVRAVLAVTAAELVRALVDIRPGDEIVVAGADIRVIGPAPANWLREALRGPVGG